MINPVQTPLCRIRNATPVEKRTCRAIRTIRRCLVFGHLGDGKLHTNINPEAGEVEVRHTLEALVYEPLGSISAEHGVGLHKKSFLHISRSLEEIWLMHRPKTALDPSSILNPGKVLAWEAGLDRRVAWSQIAVT